MNAVFTTFLPLKDFIIAGWLERGPLRPAHSNGNNTVLHIGSPANKIHCKQWMDDAMGEERRWREEGEGAGDLEERGLDVATREKEDSNLKISGTAFSGGSAAIIGRMHHI